MTGNLVFWRGLKVICIAFSISGSVGFAQTAQAPTLKPLHEILLELRDGQDLTKASYLFKRCAGYSLATTALLLRSGGDVLKERAAEWRKGAVEMVEYAVDTEMAVEKSRSPQSRKSKDEWVRETVVVAREFTQLYIERMNANYLRSGNYMVGDKWLASEHEICQEPAKRVLEAYG